MWFLVLVPVARSGACVALGGKGLRWGWFVPFLPEQASLVRELLARCKVILLFSNSRGPLPLLCRLLATLVVGFKGSPTDQNKQILLARVGGVNK